MFRSGGGEIPDSEKERAPMIQDIKIKPLKVIPDERGRLMEMLRCDDAGFQVKFGQIYMTTAYPGVTKAWHYHRKQFDHFVCVHGMIKLVLYDAREESTTRGEINEFFLGDHNPVLIEIPPMVYHGFKCVSSEEAIVVNTTTECYVYDHPDEYRMAAHSEDIPYDWSRKDR